ncbi:glmZ(sRNA)-inactivating NTPase [Corynebacterium ciconiae DSM 44920]|uniref:RapZ C-terminal domain-containing protein n=1 Tax=Corynebacterium ciconiae TaxID=227319 RepID=UPI002649FBA9|nr:RNase adapter RapZ [Corynebacterium ciconiae]WKD60909.1 glmZ(sRNA)-inactivating NTPase [Corynebacterium ciconiae DSM 44920]
MIHIISHPSKQRIPATIRYDASQLPNPHNEPALRPRDGRSPQVQQWLCDHDDFANVLDALTRRAHNTGKNKDITIAIACTAGKHRSVALAELLAANLTNKGHEVRIEHTTLNTRKQQAAKTKPQASSTSSAKTTKQRGYDQRHKRTRKALLATMTQGQPCWWCGKPMYREAEKNHDGKPLAADHIQAGGASRHQAAGRLLHFTCNSARQNGTRDHLRPALQITPNNQPNPTPTNTPTFQWKPPPPTTPRGHPTPQ